MQLTKDDVIKDTDIAYDDTGVVVTYINFNKFLQVVAFYEKYKINKLGFMEDFPGIYNENVTGEKYLDLLLFRNWLFSYCFKDGLK